jgi:hypothetical protein
VLPIVQSGVTEKVAVDDLTVKNIRSNATNGILQIVGPAAAATRVMTTPDANFTAARTDAAQSFTGNQTLSTGSLVIGTSGQGIDFSATPGTGTSELLSDYEEGTWTPSLGGTTTYLAQSGRYTKIGRVVNFHCVLYINAIGTGSVTNIGGLPFNATTSTGQGTVTIMSDCNTLISSLVGYVNSAQITLKGTTAASAAIADISVFKALTYIEIFGSYQA